MQTPPKPSYVSQKKLAFQVEAASFKTPLRQAAFALPKREFKSEYQPRQSSKFVAPPVPTRSVLKSSSAPSIRYQIRVNEHVYKVMRKIGAGGSAKVYEGFEPSTCQTVAIKIINLAQADTKTRASYFNEKAILTQLQGCKHAVRIYNSEYKEECKELVIVMEKGDADLLQVLEAHLNSRVGNHIDGIFIKFYWRGMLTAVNEIHKHGIIHADLKPVNFILVKNQIKLIDFGIASSIEPDGTSIVRDYQIGTINYMAPETLRNRAKDQSSQSFGSVSRHQMNDENSHPHSQQQRTIMIRYDTKADIWSLGCILYNFVYGRSPFERYSDTISKLQAIIDPRIEIDFPEINNQHLLNCMKSCLKYNPKDRPSAQELLNHPYLSDELVVVQRNT